jgi:hypothetical protein
MLKVGLMGKVTRLAILAAMVVLPLFGRAQEVGWQANPEVVARTSKQQPKFNYDEAKVRPFDLPDLLTSSAARVTTAAEWPARRAEILELFRQHVYGRSPGRPGEPLF